MAVNLKGRSFLTLMDFTPSEIRYMLDLSHDLKSKKRAGIFNYLLKGKNIVLLFEKTSTRTRCAFEVGALEEGAHVTYLDQNSSQMGKKESLEDTAKVLGRYYDGIEYRGYKQSVVEDLAKYSGVPVWNGLTDVDHPTQILADMLTIEEHVAKPLNKVKVVFAGDTRNNMAYAWMYGCAKMGMHFVAFGPQELAPSQEVMDKVQVVAKETGAIIEFSSDPAAVKGADVIYSDVWASMGEEDQIPARVKLLTPYKVTMELLQKTGNPDVIFMHCLPAFHDFETKMAKEWMDKGFDIREVTDEVFRSRHCVAFDEAENRMHTIKAIMVATL
jgi:ornithine carbamoyltransferase